jgi:hypothetical protein
MKKEEIEINKIYKLLTINTIKWNNKMIYFFYFILLISLGYFAVFGYFAYKQQIEDKQSVSQQIEDKQMFKNRKIIKNRKENTYTQKEKDINYIKSFVNSNTVIERKEDKNFIRLISNTWCFIELNKGKIIKQNAKGLCPDYETMKYNYDNILDISTFVKLDNSSIFWIDYDGSSSRKDRTTLKEIYSRNIDLKIFNDYFNFYFELKHTIKNSKKIIDKEVYKIPSGTIVRFSNQLYMFNGINEYMGDFGDNVPTMILSKINDNTYLKIEKRKIILENILNNKYNINVLED